MNYNIIMGDNFFYIKDNIAFIKIRVTTKASKNAIIGKKGDVLSIAVTAVPENGKANEAVIKLLSKILNCAKTNFKIISGEKSRNKILAINKIADFSLLLF